MELNQGVRKAQNESFHDFPFSQSCPEDEMSIKGGSLDELGKSIEEKEAENLLEENSEKDESILFHQNQVITPLNAVELPPVKAPWNTDEQPTDEFLLPSDEVEKDDLSIKFQMTKEEPPKIDVEARPQIQVDSSTRPKLNKDGSLLRLFQSDFFDAYFHMYYLYHRLETGIQDYLVNHLYQRSEEDIHFYLPQLCCICLARYSTSTLARFLLEKASKSMHIALKTAWLFQSLADETINEFPGLSPQLTQEIEMAIVNSKPVPPGSSLYSPQQDVTVPDLFRRRRAIHKLVTTEALFRRSQANEHDEPSSADRLVSYSPRTAGSPPARQRHKIAAGFVSRASSIVVPGARVKLPSIYAKLGSPFSYSAFRDSALMDFEMQRFVVKQRRCDYYNLLNSMLSTMIEWMFCRRCIVAASEGTFAMTGLTIPLSEFGSLSPTNDHSHSTQESKVLSSKKRAPFLVVFEVADLDEDLQQLPPIFKLGTSEFSNTLLSREWQLNQEFSASNTLEKLEAASPSNKRENVRSIRNRSYSDVPLGETSTKLLDADASTQKLDTHLWSYLYIYQSILNELRVSLSHGIFSPSSFEDCIKTRALAIPRINRFSNLRFSDSPLSILRYSMGLQGPRKRKVSHDEPCTPEEEASQAEDSSHNEGKVSAQLVPDEECPQDVEGADHPKGLEVLTHKTEQDDRQLSHSQLRDSSGPLSLSAAFASNHPSLHGNAARPKLAIDRREVEEGASLPALAEALHSDNKKMPIAGPSAGVFSVPSYAAISSMWGPTANGAVKSNASSVKPESDLSGSVDGSSRQTRLERDESDTSLKVDEAARNEFSHPPVTAAELAANAKRVRYNLWGYLWRDKKRYYRKKSPYGTLKSWNLGCVLVKGGDDVRQEMLASQLVRLFKTIFDEAGIPLYLRPYEVLITGANSGIMVFVPDTLSVDAVKKRFGSDSISKVFEAAFADNPYQAKKNFIESHAAYSIIGYLLQVKDRHNGNYLLDAEGHLIQIGKEAFFQSYSPDYGFMLSNSPGNVNFETSPFKLTPDIMEVLDGELSENYEYFRTLVCRGFLEARKHAEKIFLLVEMMTAATKMPCFVAGAEATLQALKDRFLLNLTEDACMQKVSDLIDISVHNWRTIQYDNFQRITNGIL